MLKYISEHLKNKSIGYKDMDIPIVRMNYNEYYESIPRENIVMDRLPKTLLYFKQKLYPFEEVDNDKLFMHFMNRVLYPVVILKTKKDVIRFMDTSTQWVENTPFFKHGDINIDIFASQYPKTTRVIAFISNKNEYKEELKTLSSDARDLTFREDIRIAKITNVEIVAEYKRKYDKEWFSELSSNSIVAFVHNIGKKNANIKYYDLSTDTGLFQKWVNRASVDTVEPQNSISLKIINQLQLTVFTAFIDRNDKRFGEDSKDLVKKLASIAK
jgi:hypothetical protein